MADHDLAVAMGGQLVDSFGAKVLCSRQPVVDPALASRAVHISIVPTNKTLNVALLPEDVLQDIAAEFQSRLLTFRLLHYREFEISRPLAFTPRMGCLAGALMLPFRDDRETALALMEALKEQDRDARLERHNEPECLVIVALFDVCHRKKASKVLCGQIASRINVTLKGLGEQAELGPRAVGAILKPLGLTTGRQGSPGRGLKLTSAVRRRINELARAYSLHPTSDPRVAGCRLCAETFGGHTIGNSRTWERYEQWLAGGRASRRIQLLQQFVAGSQEIIATDPGLGCGRRWLGADAALREIASSDVNVC